jgi:FkbM family methyltransferase
VNTRKPTILGKPLSLVLRAYYLGFNHPMKLRIWYTLRRAFGFPRLTVPYARTGWITVNESDHLQSRILTFGDYEPEVWAVLADHATGNEVFWDIGANIGSVSIKALQDSRVAQVHAFEPDPLHAHVLQHNLALNPNRYRVHPLALSDREERRIIHHGPQANTGLSTLLDGSITAAGDFLIDCRTIDGLVQQDSVAAPTLVKIDVEGWEYRVLDGARRVLRETPPKAIVFEAECDESAGILDGSIPSLLAEFGYRVRHVPRHGAWIEPRENYLAAR